MCHRSEQVIIGWSNVWWIGGCGRISHLSFSDWSFYVSKSLWRVRACITGIFHPCSAQTHQLWFDIDPTWGFRSLWIVHNKPSWSHQMQRKCPEPWIFCFADNVDAWSGLPHDFLCVSLSYYNDEYSIVWIFISCVQIMYPFFITSRNTMQKPLFFCYWNKCLHVKSHLSTSLSINSYGSQFPCFIILSNVFKRFKTVLWSTPNYSEKSASSWHNFPWSNASNSSSANFFGLPERSLY